MNITFNNNTYIFRPWAPTMGRVFTTPFAFDCETTLIDEERQWLTPTYVLGAAFDGRQGYFITRADVESFFTVHDQMRFALHNAPFDLAVVHQCAPTLDIYGRVDKDLVWDTQLLHRLYVLGAQGHSSQWESSLEHCANEYLGVSLPKDVVDANGQHVRLSYGRWLNRPPQDITPIYLDYLAKDAVATFLVRRELIRRMNTLLQDAENVWGYVSFDWLREQVRRWGPQTHHLQLRAAIVLREITANGLHLETAKRAELVQTLEKVLETKRKDLRTHGFLAGGQGSQTALQAILTRLERDHPDLSFPRTATEQYATSTEAMQDIAGVVPFVKLLLEFRETEKLLHSFVDKMNRQVLHPSFNVLAVTGRTTSFGQINAQNVPTDDQVRSCFIPKPGSVFIDADFKTIELATLAQACVGQFGLESKMGETINAGKDLHRLVAAQVMGKPEKEVTKEERGQAKPINFGKPGGMGNKTMAAYAKASFDVSLTDEEVAALSDAWLELFPEMVAFLRDNNDTCEELAALLELTPIAHCDFTGDSRFMRRRENDGRLHKPNAVLGGMCLKALKAPDPKTGAGKPYPDGDVDFFWEQVRKRSALLPRPLRKAIEERQPSVRLQRAVMGLVGRQGVFTLTGRLRAKASYCARHNTVFQGLAADGAKNAMWLLWRAGYRIVNFVHDQVLIEVPANSDLKHHAEEIRRLMIEGMKAVVPDIAVDVSYAASDRWYKGAEAVYSADGKELLVWKPQCEDRQKTA